jgi:hypothetical protein
MSGRRQYNEDSISIRLSGGGSVTLTFKGTLFDLTNDERTLMATLSITIQRYKESSLNANAPLEKEAQHG